MTGVVCRCEEYLVELDALINFELQRLAVDPLAQASPDTHSLERPAPTEYITGGDKFIYGTGLFDYFSEQTFRKLLSSLYASLITAVTFTSETCPPIIQRAGSSNTPSTGLSFIARGRSF